MILGFLKTYTFMIFIDMIQPAGVCKQTGGIVVNE